MRGFYMHQFAESTLPLDLPVFCETTVTSNQECHDRKRLSNQIVVFLCNVHGF